MRNHTRNLTLACLTVAFVTGLAGCLPFPLGDPAKSQVDPKLAGYWMSTTSDDQELIAMFPFDEHTYLVQDLKLKKQDDKWMPQGPASLFKGWLTNVKDVRFLTLEPLVQRLPGGTGEKPVYPALRLTTDGDSIVARLINSDADLVKPVKSSADLLALIAKELNNPDLYSGDGSKFRRLDPERDKESVQLLVNE